MDEEQKDNLTDLVEELEGVETPEDSLDDKSEQVVITEDGEEVTLDQEDIESK